MARVDENPAVAAPRQALTVSTVLATSAVLGLAGPAAATVAAAVAALASAKPETIPTAATPAKMLNILFPGRMTKVTIHVKRPAWPALELDSTFLGWTQTAGEIYIRPSVDGFSHNALFAIVYHEGLHILQFRRNMKESGLQGGRPRTYRAMVDFERAAYWKTKKWVDDHGERHHIPPDERLELAGSFSDTARTFEEIRTGVLKLAPENQEPAFRNRLIESDVLPDGHKSLADLYGY